MDRHAQEFLVMLARELPNEKDLTIIDLAKQLMKLARKHDRLQVCDCNVGLSDKQRAQEKRIEDKVVELCGTFGFKVKFSGDPRGCTVKLILPSGRYNSFGGAEDGWGVPI